MSLFEQSSRSTSEGIAFRIEESGNNPAPARIFNESLVSWVKLPVLAQDRRVRWYPIPYWAAWLVVAAALILLVSLIENSVLHRALWNRGLLDPNMVILFLLLADAGLAPIFVHHKVLRVMELLAPLMAPGNHTKSEQDLELRRIWSWSVRRWDSMLWAGLMFSIFPGLPIVVAEFRRSDPPLNSAGIVYAAVALTVFVIGAAATRIPLFLDFLRRAFRAELRAIYVAEPPSELKEIVNLLFQSAMTVGIAFGLFGAWIVLLPGDPRDNPLVYLWMGVGSVVAFVMYVLPQWFIHQALKAQKKRVISQLRRNLESSLTSSLLEPTMSALERTNQLCQLEASLYRMKEWPFDLRVVPQALVLVVVPLFSGAMNYWLHVG